MKVELISHTRDALSLLLYTKNTRLQGAQSFSEICAWPMDEKLDHLAYMLDTIQSSWEFVDYTFHIKGVTRAFTHQLVRTRTGSYAQESQRTVDVRLNEVIIPESDSNRMFDRAAFEATKAYGLMIDDGMPVQDARGILPTNMTTDIIAKFDLRTLHNMALVRLCTRTQGEYQKVFKAMRDEVVRVHPWASDFIKVSCAWNGVCAFPRYTECPIQIHTLKPTVERMNAIDKAVAECDHVANPVAKNGKTM